MWPKISVITPSFNQANYLEETMRSVLDQGYPNLEYIVIDGGSRDHSVEIIRKYEDQLAYWVSERDRGQSDAINKGFAKATGEILCWLNSDDLFLPGALTAVAEYFRRRPDVGCVVGDLRLIGPASEFLFDRKSVRIRLNRLLYGGWIVPQQSAFFTVAAFDATGPLDCSLQYQMDYDFFIRMRKSGVKFGLLPKLLAAFRLHAASKTVSEHQNLVEQANYVIRRRHSAIWLGNDELTAAAFRVLKKIFRMDAYLVRAITRGDYKPWRGLRAMRDIQCRHASSHAAV